MATENRIAYIQWIIEAIKILCDKTPIQNCLSERTRDRIGINTRIPVSLESTRLTGIFSCPLGTFWVQIRYQ